MQTFGLMKLNIFSTGMFLAAGFGALSRALERLQFVTGAGVRKATGRCGTTVGLQSGAI